MTKLNFDKEEKIIISVLGVLALLGFFLDSSVINVVYHIRNIFLDYFLSVFSLTFLLFVPLMIIATLYLYSKNKKKGIIPLWASFFTTLTITYLIKFIVHRPRMLGEILIPVIHFSDYSFPSAHAALSFAILAVIDEEFRKVKIAWLVIAILIIFSRIYFSYHYFSDVVFGALIGYGIGVITVKMLDNKQSKTKTL